MSDPGYGDRCDFGDVKRQKYFLLHFEIILYYNRKERVTFFITYIKRKRLILWFVMLTRRKPVFYYPDISRVSQSYETDRCIKAIQRKKAKQEQR